MKSLALRVLGDFGVDGVEPQALGSRKGRLALAVLALGAGQAVPSDVLIDALWDDAPPAHPEDQLAVLISRLRSVLGRDRIQHRDRGYLLRCDWLDAAELASLTEEMERRRATGNVLGAAAAARVVLSLLRGYGPPSVPGEWAQLRLAELDRLASRARRLAATALLEAGDWMTAADAATAAVDADPYDEASLRVLLRAYVAGGRPAAALAAYAKAREHLAGELGTDPSPETVEVYTAILRGDLTSPAPVFGRDAVGVVGRDEELAYLDAMAARASEGSAEIVVVDGEAGIGKTALLRAWSGRRTAAGETVLIASCGQLDAAMPLDAVLGALAALLRRLGPDAGADLLGEDAPTLAPLLGVDPVAPPGPGPRPVPILADGILGPAVLYAALVRVIGRLARSGPLVVVIDDAHLGGMALSNWLSFARREMMPALVVAAVRSGEGPPMPATAFVHLDVLGREAAAELVGPSRADELYERSKGHPLFLTELAQQASHAELPDSLVESVSARCDELGPAGAMLRAAAVIGPELDIDLLAALLGRPAVDLLDDAERASATQLLAEDGGSFRFRHDLVMQALAASATASRAALLHRQAGRVLARRPYVDPVIVAYHARLGGNLVLAARSLRNAAGRAAERFDHAAAEALLDGALLLHPDPEGWLERARVRTRRMRYGEALEDVERALAGGPSAHGGAEALEVGAWACYFDRRFAQAAQYAEDRRARRSRRGHPVTLPGGRRADAARRGRPGRGRAPARRGVLAGRGDRPGDRRRVAGGAQVPSEPTGEGAGTAAPGGPGHGRGGVHRRDAPRAAVHRARARAGRAPGLALDAFSRYTAEVDRRRVPRFGGRAVNFAGWVLRDLGAVAQGLDRHHEALRVGPGERLVEVVIAALEDLAEHAVAASDLDGAQARLAEARALLSGDIVFGWRLDLKHRLIAGRLALRRGEAEPALAIASDLEARAAALGVPRYVSVARVLGHRARRALGLPVDLAAVAADLDLLEGAVAVEAWWWTGEAAAELSAPGLLDQAADRAERLARQAGDHADVLREEAGRRLERWRATAG